MLFLLNIYYDKSIIGIKIKNERKKNNLTQEKLGELIGENGGDDSVTRQTISKWEIGQSYPTLENLLALCNIFKCDIEYLLGNIPCKTRINTDINQFTGLSEDAIKKLNTYVQKKRLAKSLISSFITHHSFDTLLCYLEDYYIRSSDLSTIISNIMTTFNLSKKDVKDIFFSKLSVKEIFDKISSLDYIKEDNADLKKMLISYYEEANHVDSAEFRCVKTFTEIINHICEVLIFYP